MVVAKLFHVLSNSLFNSIRYWLTQGFRWPLLISSSALHPKRSHILHFCHFWALGASLEASFAKSICLAIIAYSSRNYDPGEIIILMVFARTNEYKRQSTVVTQCPRKWPKITCIAQCAFLPILIAYQVIKAAKFGELALLRSFFCAYEKVHLQHAMHFFSTIPSALWMTMLHQLFTINSTSFIFKETHCSVLSLFQVQDGCQFQVRKLHTKLMKMLIFCYFDAHPFSTTCTTIAATNKSVADFFSGGHEVSLTNL